MASRSLSAAFFVAFALLLVGIQPGIASPTSLPVPQAKNEVAVDPALTKEFASSARARFWVDLKAEADLDRARHLRGWAARGSAVASQLRSTAQATQADVLDVLERAKAPHEAFWITNAVLVTGTEELATEMAARPDVTGVRATEVYSIPEPTKSQRDRAAQALAWNIEQVRADEVWGTYGVRGEGIVVANIDTGVDFDHPALVEQYRGSNGDGTFNHNYNWFDPSEICGSPSLEPCDNNFHGTHTMGTMLGDDGSNTVGVAPNATWITAKGCETRNCSDAALLASAQWILAPTDLHGENPRADLRPHIVNNSWGDDAHNPLFADAVDAWIAAGIFPVFSAGNAGPDCGTVGSPGDYDTAYSVGSHGRSGAISSFSSRGPGSATTAMNPDIAAPGASVISSMPGGGYGSASGTSMAAPHVAGTVALMWSAAPSLQRDISATRQILDQTAVDVEDLQCGGTAEDNNVWGQGKLDAMRAVTAAPRGETGTVTGTVTDGSTGEPLAGARVDLSSPLTRTVWTDTDGVYTVELAADRYDLSASLYAYQAATIPGVVVSPDATTVQDVELTPAATVTLTGVVTDPSGQPVSGTTVQVLGTPIADVTTDPDGRYSVEQVPTGSYNVRVTGSGCLGAVTKPVTLTENTTLDFSLPRPSDEFGYHCVERPSSYLLPTKEVPLEARTARLELPFPFTFYGQTYTAVNVAEHGFINFAREHPSFRNFPLPYADWPNAAIYPMWDDIDATSWSRVYTGTYGEAPNRRMVIDWRYVTFWGAPDDVRFDVQVILHENGDIVTQYRRLDSQREHGDSATVGIENADGSDGLQYSHNQAVLTDEVAIHFLRPPNGFATGVVTDANDGQPIRGAEVTLLQDGAPVRERLTDGAGRFKIEASLGTYGVRITTPRYVTSTQSITIDEDDEYVDVGASLETARAVVEEQEHTIVVPAGQTRTRTLSIGNTGSVDLEWELLESDQPAAGGAGSKPADVDPHSFEGQGAPPGVSAADTGDLVRQWRIDDRPDLFGVGVDGDGNVWLGGLALEDSNTEYAVNGTPTGREWPTPWAQTWAADMAYDSRHDQMCQVEVGGSNGIGCWNPATGEITAAIAGDFAWTDRNQRGLAYRPDDDTFYIGGYLDGTVFHVAGLSHANPGEVLDSCQPSDGSISGLGWNPATQTLWMSTHSPDDIVYQLDPATCSVISTLAHPRPGLHGGGLALDQIGNLWMVDRDTKIAYLYDAGTSALIDVPWLQASGPGTIDAGEESEVEFSIDTTGMSPGVYDVSILLASNSGRNPYLQVPIRLVVSAYRVGINAGGNEYIDPFGDVWHPDKRHAGEGWGHLGTSHARSTNKAISGTTDDLLFQHRRDGDVTYRFDDIPAGTYLIDLGFAEFTPRPKPGKRLFGVIINGEQVLRNHDVAAEVGGRTADLHKIRIEHAGGDLVVELEGQGTRQHPILNALRVTERSDL